MSKAPWEEDVAPWDEGKADSQYLRTFAQGATFGFGDEIEAAVRSVFPESMGGGKYEQVRDDLRGKLKAFKAQNPGAALTTEIAGALLPSLAATFFTGGAAAAPSLARVAAVGAGQGAASGLGYSEAKDATGMALDTGVGAVTGGVLAPVATVATKGLTGGAAKVLDYARTKLGTKPANAVTAELQRLMQATGKSADEIVDDVANGRLMSDNATLMMALKGYVTKGGKAGQAVRELAPARAAETGAAAKAALRQELAPDLTENVVKGYKTTEGARLAAEGQAYKDLFANAPKTLVDASTVDDMLKGAQALPEVVAEANKSYRLNNIVPLFANVDGAVKMVRQPTLQDAEIVRRTLADQATGMFKSPQGNKGLATEIKALEQSLKGKLDALSPELQATRANWANIKSASKAFEEGRKALSQNVDELDMAVEKLAGKPEIYKAFKAGVMDSVRNRLRRTGTTFSQLADDDKQLGAALRSVLNNKDISALESQLKTAADTKMIAQKVLPEGGSPTELLRREMNASGMNLSMSDIMGAAQGSPSAIVSSMAKLMKGANTGLTDDQALQVVKTMYSRDPALVRKALTDKASFDALVDKMGWFLQYAAPAARSAATTQTTKGLLGMIGAQ